MNTIKDINSAKISF